MIFMWLPLHCNRDRLIYRVIIFRVHQFRLKGLLAIKEPRMKSQENLAAVKEAYAAFGRGDIPLVLEMMAEDVHWTTPGPRDLVPFAGEFKGRPAVAEYFTSLAATEETLAFEPHEFIVQGELVVACVFYRARVRATGRIYETETVHIFRFYNGRVIGFREYLDTALMAAAYKAA